MNILAWDTAHWNNAEEARQIGEGPLGLIEWERRVRYFFSPRHVFIACGTYSDPALSPLGPEVPIINSGIEQNAGKYCFYYRQYWCCAATAAMAYALNRRDWDLMVLLCHDTLVGSVDFDSLLREFLTRKEIILTNRWCDCPGGPFLAMKREAASIYLHQRKRANIIPETEPLPMIGEWEMKLMFGGSHEGRWWDAWPEVGDVRQRFRDTPDALRALDWPFIDQPDPKLIEIFLKEQSIRAKPVKPASPLP